jgi:hypothetical protein
LRQPKAGLGIRERSYHAVGRSRNRQVHGYASLAHDPEPPAQVSEQVMLRE